MEKSKDLRQNFCRNWILKPNWWFDKDSRYDQKERPDNKWTTVKCTKNLMVKVHKR